MTATVRVLRKTSTHKSIILIGIALAAAGAGSKRDWGLWMQRWPAIRWNMQKLLPFVSADLVINQRGVGCGMYVEWEEDERFRPLPHQLHLANPGQAATSRNAAEKELIKKYLRDQRFIAQNQKCIETREDGCCLFVPKDNSVSAARCHNNDVTGSRRTLDSR